MALLTLEDLAIALGREIQTDEEPAYQYLINSITSFIENYTGIAFTRHTEETVRYRADGHGIVSLVGPVVDVQTISAVAVDNPPGFEVYNYYGPYYDGFDEIYYLPPHAVVDVTYTYGLDTVPEDIKSVATEVVKGVVVGGDSSELDTYTVGDITERFKLGWGIDSFNSLQQLVLEAYRGVGMTWRL